MRFGVCLNMEDKEQIKAVSNAGFDYVECSFTQLSRAEDAVFEKFVSDLEETGIACESANCFIPGDLPIIGTDYARDEMKAFIERGMSRGEKLGIKAVVFGSGKARRLPDGYPFSKGIAELVGFLRDVVAPVAESHGITVVIEPLRRNETNMIHTLDEGSMLAAFVGRKGVACLGDMYHMWGAGDDFEDIRRLKGCIFHSHLANPVKPDGSRNRAFPKDKDEFDYKGFFDALEFAGCERCSIEAERNDFIADTLVAGKVLKEFM